MTPLGRGVNRDRWDWYGFGTANNSFWCRPEARTVPALTTAFSTQHSLPAVHCVCCRCDLRETARIERHSGQVLGHAAQSENAPTFFSGIVESTSDVKFSRDGRHVMVRDYMSLKIWDVHMMSSPLRTIKVHEELRPKLCALYDSDHIFDR